MGSRYERRFERLVVFNSHGQPFCPCYTGEVADPENCEVVGGEVFRAMEPREILRAGLYSSRGVRPREVARRNGRLVEAVECHEWDRVYPRPDEPEPPPTSRAWPTDGGGWLR